MDSSSANGPSWRHEAAPHHCEHFGSKRFREKQGEGEHGREGREMVALASSGASVESGAISVNSCTSRSNGMLAVRATQQGPTQGDATKPLLHQLQEDIPKLDTMRAGNGTPEIEYNARPKPVIMTTSK